MIAAALLCLASAVYHEARGESTAGQQAVALVTMNRAEGNPRRVCREVHKTGQYSWVGKGLPKKEREAWLHSREIAADVLYGRVDDFTGGATYFHAKAVRPVWRHKLKYLMTIGGHRFYRPYK
ncbi:cell wall hydrolase [Massilia sp. TN1-12]|uniref:cell wall hydrolase n=1 Tax=Massilia paldalensis TaxID=3377675 RepID=UPI00384B01F9